MTIRSVPKAELHCHIEGAAQPELVLRQAKKYGVDPSAHVRDGRYVWNDFTTFLAAYDFAASLFRSPQDYELLAHEHFSHLAAQNCLYGEVFISPDHAARMGIAYPALTAAMAEGMDRARDETGIEGRMIAVGLRHEGPEAVEATARLVASVPHPLVTGFGMAGDERMFRQADFAAAFRIAGDAGLRLTVHAGELSGAFSVREALDHLGVERIGHGVRAIEDPELVARIAEEKIVLETCPGSNIAIGVFPDFASHPFRQLEEAGCLVTLSSDDPPFFASSISREYEIAGTEFGYGEAELAGFTRTAIEAAFTDGETRARLLEKLDRSLVI